MDNKLVIAIDGYSGCGKSSTAKALAGKLNYIYIDSGAMYRAVTYYLLTNKLDWHDKGVLLDALKEITISFKKNSQNGKQETYLNGNSVEKDIRIGEISSAVSGVAAISDVRRKLVQLQQEFGKNGGLVMDGRDIGTVVFPSADIKIFMTAEVDIRAQRRQEELMASGVHESFEEIKQNLIERDRLDTSRKDSPLMKASDAIEIDTSNLTFDAQVEKILKIVNEKV